MLKLRRFARNKARRADLAALLAGGLLPLAYAPVGFYPLAILAPAVLFAVWRDAAPRRAARHGFLFGLGQFGVGVSWVYVAIHDFGHSGVPLAVFLTAVFVAVLALFPAALGYTSARFYPRADTVKLLLVLPAGWTLAEWVRGWILTGFPWLNVGYSQIDAPLRGLAPLLGVYGVSLAVAFSAALLVAFMRARGRARMAAAAAFAALWLGAGLLALVEWTHPAGPPLRVSLVQGDIPQDTKWRPELVPYTRERYAELTRAHWGDAIVIWPEAALTEFADELPPDFLGMLERNARTHRTDLLIGIPYIDRGARRYYNSMMSMGATHAFYHKRHLVPFGDYVPFEDWLRSLISFFDLPMSGFSAGPARQPLLTAAGYQVATAICYEDIFGEELIEALPAAAFLVNATNNAWYGDSFAPHQHLEMSRMRALETGRYMLRATTNGISAIIDEKGGTVAQSRQFAADVVSASATPMQGATPYVRIGNWGALFIVLAMCAAASVVRVCRR